MPSLMASADTAAAAAITPDVQLVQATSVSNGASKSVTATCPKEPR